MKSVILSICFLAFITFGHAQSPQKTSLIACLLISGITFNLTPDGDLINLYDDYCNCDRGQNFLRSTTWVDGHKL